ncbi:MAG: dehydrogenase, partial [Planctomycetes bacterium RBG_16_64_10]
MSSPTRRTFLKRTVAAGAAFSTFTISGTKSSGTVLGANDTIRVGVAGIRGRGGSHIDSFAKMKGVQVSHLIDPDRSLFESRAKQVQAMTGTAPKCFQDIRAALDDKNLDAISIATCNHWHSLITIWACQAGKDVYVEKPCSHNVFEGRQCIAAAAKYNRIVQHGTQNRGNISWARQVAAVASGQYGKLLVSKAYASKPRWSIGFQSIEDPPEHIDFNLWLGPAPEQPFHRNLVHYNWHWFWDTGNGEVGNQGVHQMDVARWAIPGATLPQRVTSMGGRWVNSTEGHTPFTDQGQTPNCQLTVMDFGDTLLVYEIIGLVNKPGVDGKNYPSKVANEFYLEAGVIKDGKFYPKGSDQAEDLVETELNMGPGDIFANFIHCVRDRKRDALHANIVEGHLSSACCHLSNISYRL